MSEPKTKMTLLLTTAERARLDVLRLARGDRSAAATLRALVRAAEGLLLASPRAPAAAEPREQLERRAAALRAKLEDGSETARDRRELLDTLDELQGIHAREEEREGRVLMSEIARTQIAMLRRIDEQIQSAPRHAPAPAPEPDDPGMPEWVELDVPAARADYLASVGCSPEEYLRRWRAGKIPDTLDGMLRYQRALLLEAASEDSPARDAVCSEAEGFDAVIEAIHGAASAATEAEHSTPQPPNAAELAELVLLALPRWAGLDPGGDPPDPLHPAHVRGAARAARELADALERIADRA